MLFSKSAGGFFCLDVSGDDLPSDSVEISDELYQELLTGQSTGKMIGSTSEGLPVLLDPPPTPVTAADVDLERDRRMALGISFLGSVFQTRPEDRDSINEKALIAFMAVTRGAKADDLRWSNPEQDFKWIASDNSLVPMDAHTVIAFAKAVSDRKELLTFAARQIKDSEQIPLNFKGDGFWP